MKLALLESPLSFKSLNSDDLAQLVILPAGVVELYEMEPLLVDAEAAESIIVAFNDQGVDVPIDFEHSAVKKAERGEPAPAAAWITNLTWDEQKGLIADVEWTQEAFEMVMSGQYKYLSPVVLIDSDTGRPLVLHSAAFTNKPRIKNQEELLAIAASSSFSLSGIINKENMMVTRKVAPPTWIQKVKGGKLKRVLMQADESTADEPIAGVPVEDGVVDEAAAAEVGSLIDTIKELLISQGVEIAEDATAIDILNATGNFLMGLIETVAEAEDAPPVEDVAAEVAVASVKPPAPPGSSVILETELCDQLGLKRGTPKEKIVASISALKGHVGHVSVAKYNELAERLGVIEYERGKANVDVVMGSMIEQQKLNPYDADQMRWARETAVKDLDGFKTIMASAPRIISTGRVVPPSAPASDESKNARDGVIASAVEAYKATPNLARMCKVESFVNGELAEVQQGILTKDELAKIC